MTPHILIAIPTCKRPQMLTTCLRSIAKLDIPQGVNVSLLIADNDADESAKEVYEQMKSAMPFAANYSVCAERGLSHIRNHILEEAIQRGADYLLCIDDDNIASPTWLERSYAALIKKQADAVGPGDGLKENPRLSTESILLSAKIYRDMSIRYDTAFNFTGAEDDDFAKRAINAGAKFASDPSIIVYRQESDHREGWWHYTTHHYARFAANAYVNRTKYNRPAIYFIVDTVSYLLKGILLIPFTPFSDSAKQRCIKSLVRCVAFPRSLFAISPIKT